MSGYWLLAVWPGSAIPVGIWLCALSAIDHRHRRHNPGMTPDSSSAHLWAELDHLDDEFAEENR